MSAGFPASTWAMARATAAKSGFGPKEVHADVGAGFRGTTLAGHADLVFPIVVVGPVVEHDHQERDLVLGGEPERAQVEHQIAVGLQVDHQAAATLVGQGDAQGDADLGRRAQGLARVPIGLVQIP